jgi:DNA-directed RNA polymerase subunit RPC12/RpoP
VSWVCEYCGKRIISDDKAIKCPNCGAPRTKKDEPTSSQKSEKEPESQLSQYIELALHLALSFIPVILALQIFVPLFIQQGVPIYIYVIFVVGGLLTYIGIRRHGIIFGIIIAIVAAIFYLFLLAVVTGNVEVVYAVVSPFVPTQYQDSLKTNLQTGFQTLKCSFNPLNFQNCISSSSGGGGGNPPKICKPIDQYKFLNIQWGEAPDYVLINPVRADHIFVAEITIMPNNDYTTSGITISGELKNTTGSTIKMKTDACLTTAENCQVGPGLPPLSITLRSADKVNFLTNDLAYLYVYVSYPVTASGSSTFYIGKSRTAIQSELANNLGPSLGTGPLDSHITFSTNYYITGSSKYNPDAANIEVYANVINGKKNCYGEEGFGRMAQIKISHTSDVQGITASCKTPEQDSFNEGESRDIPGTPVTNIQTYTCTFIAPDDIGNTGATSVKFTSDISYNYTEVKMTQGMSVCPSDTSISCQ